jgi:hypothetical protein
MFVCRLHYEQFIAFVSSKHCQRFQLPYVGRLDTQVAKSREVGISESGCADSQLTIIPFIRSWLKIAAWTGASDL